MTKRAKVLLLSVVVASLCMINPGYGAEVMVSDADIQGETVWKRDNTYILTEFVFVEEGESLTIEAGTLIKGQPGQGADASALIVARGGKIFAEGTPHDPIIFTSVDDDVGNPTDFGPNDRGHWGGVLILGRARINSGGVSDDPVVGQVEGIPTSEPRARFGGSDDEDSSGVFRYVSIRHGGSIIGADNEINGLTLAAVGSKTTVEYVEVYANQDDGIEFFGGAVNVSHATVAFCGDDSFDYDVGWRGKGQFWFTIGNQADRGGEHDGDTVDGTQTPLSNPTIYNATYIGNGTDGTGNGQDALKMREGAAGKYFNSIFTSFDDKGLDIDEDAATRVESGALNFEGNIFWDMGAGDDPSVFASETAQPFFTDQSRNNQVVDPKLRGISRAPDNALDPRPAAGSPALASDRTPPSNGFFEPVSYKGAFSPNNLWIKDWTILDETNFLPAQDQTEMVSDADISGDAVWTQDKTYILTEFVFVEDGETLTIEPGTVIKGEPGQGADASALIVARGGKIFAEGTPNNPIIFTALDDNVSDPFDFGPNDRGMWGGVLILGRARINSGGVSDDPIVGQVEGIPTSEPRARFGGDNDEDNSGLLRYVSIRHGGSIIGADNEINGLTLAGVGNNTTLDHIEVYANQDDGIEWFGGTAQVKHAVVGYCGDDSFDYDVGWRGKGQFWFTIGNQADRGGEHDGDTVDGTQAPLSNPTIYNVTYIGNGTDGSGNGQDALKMREGAAGKYFNSIFTSYDDMGLDIDEDAATRVESGALNLENNIFWDMGAGDNPASFASETAQIFFMEQARNNEVVDPMLRKISRQPEGGLDPRPAKGSPALETDRTAPESGFFSPVAYQGAFMEVNWVADWTALAASRLITTRGARSPEPMEPEEMGDDDLMIGVSLGQDAEGNQELTLQWTSKSGVTYQLQSSTDLQTWSDVGEAVEGTGNMVSSTESVSGKSLQFFRVILQ